MKNNNSINLQKAKVYYFFNWKGWFNHNWKRRKTFTKNKYQDKTISCYAEITLSGHLAKRNKNINNYTQIQKYIDKIYQEHII